LRATIDPTAEIDLRLSFVRVTVTTVRRYTWN
jgi:hypothetical protein